MFIEIGERERESTIRSTSSNVITSAVRS